MAAPSAQRTLLGQLAQFSFGHLHHPLHLGVSDENMSIIALNNEVVNTPRAQIIAISVKQRGLNGRGKRQARIIFASLQPLTSDHDAVRHLPTAGDTAPISLYCSRVFLDRYGFDKHELVYFKPVKLFPIYRVVLEASTRAAFSWARKQLFSTGLLLSVCQEDVLIRRGDPFLAPCCRLFLNEPDFSLDHLLNLRVLDCDPVTQGALTINTEVVILDGSNMESDPSNSTPLISKPVIASTFALPTSMPVRPKHWIYLEQQRRTNRIKDRPWQAECGVRFWNDLPAGHENLSASTDVHGCLFVSKKLALESGLFHGGLIELRLSDHEQSADQSGSTSHKARKPQNGFSSMIELNGIIHTSSAKKTKKLASTRVATIHIVDDLDKETSLFSSCQTSIQPTLFFNLSKDSKCCVVPSKTQVLIQKFERRSSSSSEPSSSSSCNSQIPYASEVHISIVKSPDYSGSSSFSAVLQQYFTVPRLLQLGDVICISTESDVEFQQDLTDGTEIRQPTVYFKVTKILPKSHGHRSTFLADIQHTTVFQGAAIHGFVPPVQPRMESLHPPGLQDYVVKLQQILKPYLIARSHCEDLQPSILLSGPSGCGKSSLCRAVTASLNMHYFQVNCHELCGETSAATEARIKHVLQRAATYAPCILALKNIECLGKDRDGNTEDPRVSESFQSQICKLHEENSDWPVVVIAITSAVKHLSADIHDTFLHHIEIEVPAEAQRRDILNQLLRDVPCASDVSIAHLAQRTAGLVLGDLCALLCHARRKAFHRAKSLCGHGEMTWEEEEDLCLAGFMLKQEDFETALDQLQAAHSDAVGAPKIPKVSWEDIGGLANVKADILDTIQLPLQHPELFAAGLRRSGVLLYGPPGTGKTLLAKAVATECSLNFLSVKGPELINMYVGQSEENVREVFSRARNATPCVVFFDELDSLAPNRGRSADSGGVMDRVVSQLLAELDGLHKSCDVFVVGATNRPDLLDPALLRPGRFDKLLYLGVSEDRSSQIKIMQALTRKFNLSDGCSLERIVARCPLNLTGADFYALCSDAMLCALKVKIEQLESGDIVDQSYVCVHEEHFTKALERLVPSVSAMELQRYKAIQDHFRIPK